MGWKAFIVHLVEALAWPATVLAAALTLRKPLERLMDRVRTVRARQTTVEFSADHEVREVSGGDETPDGRV